MLRSHHFELIPKIRLRPDDVIGDIGDILTSIELLAASATFAIDDRMSDCGSVHRPSAGLDLLPLSTVFFAPWVYRPEATSGGNGATLYSF